MADKQETGKFEYLFVDIEWNQAPKTTEIEFREPIQIGIVAADENMEIKKIFSKAMRLSNPEYYNPDTLTISHFNINTIMQANSEEEVFRNVKQTFPKYKYIVVWTIETYELFKREMDKYEMSLPRHSVVVLQNVLMNIACNGKKLLGFEVALKQAGIEYQKNYLHYSKHDANYLYQLFFKCYEEYKKWTNQEVCYLNKRTHIMHTENCRYIKNSQEITYSKATRDIIFQGYRVCKVCGSEENWNRLQWDISYGCKWKKPVRYMREMPLTIENIGVICNRFKLEYKIITDVVFIRTPFSRWIVYLEDNKVKELQHENYRPRKSQAVKLHKKFMENYHKQKLPSKNFYDVVSYIKYHDMGMLKKLSEKSRIEKMFDMIKE